MDKKKILYVDDEPVNLSNFQLNFAEEFDVITASSGADALSLFNEHVDKGLAVVVADNRMPGMSGVELMGRIFEINPDPVRIILTAFTDFDQIMEAVNKGHIYQYVLKPWEYHSLRLLLVNAVEVYSMITSNKKLLVELARKNAELTEIADQLRRELECREKEEALRRSIEVKMLHQSKLASLGEMATGVAHEINQPLSFIKIMMQATKRDFKEGQFDAAEFAGELDELLAQIKRIEIITRHLQTFGRKSSVIFDQIELPRVLDNALVPIGHRLKKAGIALDIEIEKDLQQVKGVATKLEQVFINLICNAVDALENVKEKKLAIRFSRQNGAVVVTLADNGCGMPGEVTAKMFEPFFTTKEVGKGTGLGLAIVYGIMNEHNGTISCHSKPGEGTSFVLSLPVAMG
jgi:C4-dicarboxylate-specific signal transduction histidine kinase